MNFTRQLWSNVGCVRLLRGFSSCDRLSSIVIGSQPSSTDARIRNHRSSKAGKCLVSMPLCEEQIPLSPCLYSYWWRKWSMKCSKTVQWSNSPSLVVPLSVLHKKFCLLTFTLSTGVQTTGNRVRFVKFHLFEELVIRPPKMDSSRLILACKARSWMKSCKQTKRSQSLDVERKWSARSACTVITDQSTNGDVTILSSRTPQAASGAFRGFTSRDAVCSLVVDLRGVLLYVRTLRGM